ncbi:hypothetical protein V3C99_006478 [Haemonchus contortus]
MIRISLLFGIISGVNGIRILPETPIDFSIHLCTHQRRHAHGHMQYLPHPVRYCMTVKSSKSPRDLIRDRQGAIGITSSVIFTWRQVTSARQCRFGFQGYQGEYRLAPDFGAYEECQYVLSRYSHALSEVLARDGPLSKTLRFNASEPDCPFIYLPTNYADYVSCSLKDNEWYVLDWQSSIRYETYHKGVYYANHTTSFVFQPSDILLRNGTETEWLARLIHLETRTDGCEDASLLIRFHEYWPLTSTITIYYYIKDGQRISYDSHLVTASVNGWLQQDFSLIPEPGIHEVCVKLNGQPEIRHRVCRVVVDRAECPFPQSSNAAILPIFSFVYLIVVSLWIR